MLPRDHAHAEAGQVVIARGVEVRQDGRLAAEQGALRLEAAGGNALDKLLQQVRIVLGHGHVVEEEQRLGAQQRASLTLMATRSMPTVLWTPAAMATLSFVPTPSVQDTSTGSLYFRAKRRLVKSS